MSPSPVLIAASAALGMLLGPTLAELADRTRRDRSTGRRPMRIAAALLASASFALATWRFGADPLLPGYLVLAAAAVALSIVDLTERRLPNALVWPTAAAVVTLLAGARLVEHRPLEALGVGVGALAMFAAYLALSLLVRGGIGMGDVKLALTTGAALGCLGAGAWTLGLAAGFVVNGVVALVTLALRRTTLRGSIPFGPSMLAGVLIAIAVS